jgi:hypothetical protein
MVEQETPQEAVAEEAVLVMEVEILEILELQVTLEATSLQTLGHFKQAVAAAAEVLEPTVLLA